jgi:hypothetical protein
MGHGWQRGGLRFVVHILAAASLAPKADPSRARQAASAHIETVAAIPTMHEKRALQGIAFPARTKLGFALEPGYGEL